MICQIIDTVGDHCRDDVSLAGAATSIIFENPCNTRLSRVVIPGDLLLPV